jgi:GNAT superfamily N-acetyltransferase
VQNRIDVEKGNLMMEGGRSATVKVMRTIDDYPPGLIGTIAALFGRCIAASHGVDWTLDVMIAEQQCEFFRRFDPERDRVWVAMDQGVPQGGLTIEGPRPSAGQESARLRFFILDEALRGRGLGRRMVAEALQFCREQRYRRVYLTTLPGLEAALRLYYQHGFVLVSESEEAFHGSRYVQQTLEWRII